MRDPCEDGCGAQGRLESSWWTPAWGFTGGAHGMGTVVRAGSGGAVWKWGCLEFPFCCYFAHCTLSHNDHALIVHTYLISQNHRIVEFPFLQDDPPPPVLGLKSGMAALRAAERPKSYLIIVSLHPTKRSMSCWEQWFTWPHSLCPPGRRYLGPQLRADLHGRDVLDLPALRTEPAACFLSL